MSDFNDVRSNHQNKTSSLQLFSYLNMELNTILSKILPQVHNTPFPNLFAATTCHMKTKPYLVNGKQTDICM